MQFLPTPRSARFTTASDTRVWATWAVLPDSIPQFFRTSATSSVNFSVSAIFSEAEAGGALAPNAAPICAKTSTWNSRKRSSALKSISKFAAMRLATRVTDQAPRRAKRRCSAVPAMAAARCAISRDSSASPAPVLHAKEHAFFEREGNDLHCVVPVSFAQAALGTEIMVATMEGDYKLKIPEGTQSGTSFRIRNRGVPVLNGHGKGDLFVEVRVQTPGKLNKRQRELLSELGQLSPVENKPQRRSLLGRVKDMFV